ncbi:MAG: M15 family metallopeptidase [Clostridiales bacterium]|nr:M15 family metallopeptidase [Clostridiales bacterium]
MNSRLQRLKVQEENTIKQRKLNTRMARLIVALALLCASLIGMGGVIMTIKPKDKPAPAEEDSVKDTPKAAEIPEKDKWKLILVNKDNPVPRDFTVDLIAFGNSRVDYRIKDELSNMIEAAGKDGIVLNVCSGYRSVSEQKELYDKRVLSYIAQGYSEEAGKIYANQYIQPPGASEHHTGLAVDFITDGSSKLDESFAQTEAYKWLKENAEKYGFIERYPKDKIDITGVAWEPWHFRYVGVEYAKTINSMGICLEEYV